MQNLPGCPEGLDASQYQRPFFLKSNYQDHCSLLCSILLLPALVFNGLDTKPQAYSLATSTRTMFQYSVHSIHLTSMRASTALLCVVHLFLSRLSAIWSLNGLPLYGFPLFIFQTPCHNMSPDSEYWPIHASKWCALVNSISFSEQRVNLSPPSVAAKWLQRPHRALSVCSSPPAMEHSIHTSE